MSTSAKINVLTDDGSAHAYSIDRPRSGMPRSAGVDILSALYPESKRPEKKRVATFGCANAAGSIATLLIRGDEGHRLVPASSMREYEYIYDVDASRGVVVMYEREWAESWDSSPGPQGGTVYKPTPEEQAAHQLVDRISQERSHANGRTLVHNFAADGGGQSFVNAVGLYGQPIEEKATPILPDDVATWINPESGDLVGRSLVAGTPRISINENHKPSPSEAATQNGVRALIDWEGRQAVTDEGAVFALSRTQLSELARAYQRKPIRKV